MIVYDRVATPSSYVCFDSWFPGIERCERESDASCQVELVLVSICVSVLAVVGLCRGVGFSSMLHGKHRVRSNKFTYDEE